MFHKDEGFADEEPSPTSFTFPGQDEWVQHASLRDKEELAYKLLSSLPISNLAKLQRKIAPLLQLDIVGLLPTELSLQIFSHLQYQHLLLCALVSRRWHVLADDSCLWRRLCTSHAWQWREPPESRLLYCSPQNEFDDEGVGEDEDDWTSMDTDVISTSRDTSAVPMRHPCNFRHSKFTPSLSHTVATPFCHPSQPPLFKPDYKLLHQTHILLLNRIRHSSYRLTYLQTRDTPNSHTSTIYCLQLYTFADLPGHPGRQVLFTGSMDKTIRQWDLSKGTVERVFQGAHDASVLSLCVRKNLIVSGGNDRRIVIWDVETGKVVKVIEDHLDSVLCVRFDDTRLVSCSKDQTVRTYLFPDLSPHLVLDSHRAAVNVISITPTQIVSASGDRSIRLWDAKTGALLYCLEHHHNRGIASIDFAPPYILSGSSDTHLRLFNVLTSHGWSTSPEFERYGCRSPPSTICQGCGSGETSGDCCVRLNSRMAKKAHGGLVRNVALGDQFVVSGSYDQTVKVWDRATGELVADLMGGHNGKICCVGSDSTKIVSCGEDQRICIWDFAHGITTSFIKL